MRGRVSGRQRLLVGVVAPCPLSRLHDSAMVAVLEQMPTIRQQHGHLIKAAQLIGIRLRRRRHLIELQRHRLEPLLQFHQALRKRGHRLGKVLGGAGDPEGDRFTEHGCAGNCPDDTTTRRLGPPSDCVAMAAPLNLLAYVLAGLGGGLLALRTGIPAAPLAGALLGAGALSMSGRLETAQWPVGSRTLLEIGIGTVIGTGLTNTALAELRQLWRPAVVITLSLVVTGLVVGLCCSRLLGIDPVVALLGAAPGGISGMSLVGAEFGVGAAVASLHAVRLITVLLVLPITVRLVLGNAGTPPG